MQFESKDGKIRFDAIRINNVAFSGQAFTGAPFEGDDGDGWIHGAISSGMVSMVSGDATEHAVWAVNVGNGEAVLASPGDYVVKQVGTEALYVCLGSLWELLTQPVQTIQDVCDALQSEVDAKAEAVAKEHRSEFDVTKWCNYVEECLASPDVAFDVDWQLLFNELHNDIGDAEIITMPPRAFRLYGVLTHMVNHRMEPDDRYFRNAAMWAEIIQDARAKGDVFLERVLKDRVDGGESQDLVTVAPTVRQATPEEIGHPNPAEGRSYGMVLESSLPVLDQDNNVVGTAHVGEVHQMSAKEVLAVRTTDAPTDYDSRMNAWCDRVHREYLNLHPNVLRPWVGLAEEVEVIMAGREVASLPRAWLIAYGTVHAMAKQYELLKPGPDELEALMVSKNIGATMANQLLGSEE